MVGFIGRGRIHHVLMKQAQMAPRSWKFGEGRGMCWLPSEPHLADQTRCCIVIHEGLIATMEA